MRTFKGEPTRSDADLFAELLHSQSISITLCPGKLPRGVYAKWTMLRIHSNPLKIHTNTHTCLSADKTSNTAAPNVFAHRCRLTALPHWMTWTIYSDAQLNPRGNLDWDWKKERVRHDLKAFRERTERGGGEGALRGADLEIHEPVTQRPSIRTRWTIINRTNEHRRATPQYRTSSRLNPPWENFISSATALIKALTGEPAACTWRTNWKHQADGALCFSSIFLLYFLRKNIFKKNPMR